MNTKGTLLTIGLAFLLNINSKEIMLNTPKGTINPNIEAIQGSGTIYKNSDKNITEKSLDRLCRYSNNEDAWAYRNKILVDIGLNEEKLSLYVDNNLLNNTILYASTHDTITLYHMHPDAYAKGYFCPPTIGDIFTLAQIQRKHKLYTFAGKMFDGYGMWEYSADENLAKKINSDEKTLRQEEEKIRTAMKIKDNQCGWNIKTYIDPASSVRTYDKTSINEFISAMNAVGVILKFTPSRAL